MEIACELNPYDAWTLIAAGMFHSFIGNRSRAEDLSAQAMELTLSPSFAQWIYLATTRYLCGDDEGLLVASGHAHALTPEPYPWRTAALNNLFAWRAAAMWNLGRKEEAREEARRFLELTRRELVRPVATGRCDDRPVAAAHLSDFGSRGVAAAACGRYRCRHPRWRHDASRLVIRCGSGAKPHRVVADTIGMQVHDSCVVGWYWRIGARNGAARFSVQGIVERWA